MKKLTFLVLATFCMALSLRADLIWYEGFNYTNGFVEFASTNLWVTNVVGGGGAVNDMFINNNRLEVSATGGTVSRANDCNRLFAITNSSPYTNGIQVVYASFTVICTNLPNGVGTYFASFYSETNTTLLVRGLGYCGRVQAFTNGSVLPRTWRLGVSDNASSTNAANGGFPVDLALNTPYQVVEELDPITLQAASVWVNPINVNNTGVSSIDPLYTASDAINFQLTNQVNSYAFRQASGFGNAFFVVTNLAIATTFAEAMTNVCATNAFPPTIVYQPIGVTNFVAIPISVSAVANGQGLGSLTYQWQKNGVNFANPAGNKNSLPFSSPVTTDSGDYTLIVTTPYGLSTTSSVAKVLISNVPVPPSFITQPVSQTVYGGQSVTFSTTVSSPGNIFYQWKSNSVDIVGATASTLTLNNVTTNYSGSHYSVAVTNDVVTTGIVSSNAVLTVLSPAVVSIGYLRTLVDPVTYLATNVPPTIPYQVTGIITTFTNITTGNTFSYYLQDGTGGINIFGTLGSTFRPALGDVVTFVGVVSSFSSGLELYADPDGNYPYTSYTDLSNNIAALPAPIAIPFTVMNDPSNANYNLGGSLVKISDVHFGARGGTTTSTTANDFVSVTNSTGQTFTVMFPELDLDVAGQTLPNFAYTVSGVLYSANSTVTNTIVVTRFSDVVTNAITPIPLTAVFSGGNVTFTWSDASFSLQSATNLPGPFSTIIGATSGFTTNTASQPEMFFRLFHP